MFSCPDEIRSQNKIIYHKMLQINSKKYLEIQRHSKFLQSVYPDFILRSSVFQLESSWVGMQSYEFSFLVNYMQKKVFPSHFNRNSKINYPYYFYSISL